MAVQLGHHSFLCSLIGNWFFPCVFNMKLFVCHFYSHYTVNKLLKQHIKEIQIFYRASSFNTSYGFNS